MVRLGCCRGVLRGGLIRIASVRRRHFRRVEQLVRRLVAGRGYLRWVEKRVSRWMTGGDIPLKHLSRRSSD